MDLNVNEVKKIAKKNHTAEIIVTSLAMRERLSHNTMLERFKTALKGAGERIDDKEYMAFWKDLETAGVGRIVSGRGKTPDHFEWFYSLKDVSQLAIGEKVEVAKIDTKKPSSRKKGYKKNTQKVVAENKNVAQTFIESSQIDTRLFVTLENGSLFEIVLPSVASKKDVTNIVKAIQKTASL